MTEEHIYLPETKYGRKLRFILKQKKTFVLVNDYPHQNRTLCRVLTIQPTRRLYIEVKAILDENRPNISVQ